MKSFSEAKLQVVLVQNFPSKGLVGSFAGTVSLLLDLADFPLPLVGRCTLSIDWSRIIITRHGRGRVIVSRAAPVFSIFTRRSSIIRYVRVIDGSFRVLTCKNGFKLTRGLFR